LKANAEFWFEFGHGCNNDRWLTIDDAGLGPHMRLMMAVYCLPYAPWGKGEKFHQVSEAVGAFCKLPVEEIKCPLFEESFHELVDDFGLEDSLHLPTILQAGLFISNIT